LNNPMMHHIQSLPDLLRSSFDDVYASVQAALPVELCRSVGRVYITGCGDSHHAALGAELAFETLSGVPVEAHTPLTFSRYTAARLPRTQPALVIGISVSGSVARTAEALSMGLQAGAYSLALTANPQGRTAQAAGKSLLVVAPELPGLEGQIIPGVRTYTINQYALLLAAVHMGQARGVLTADQAGAALAQLRALPDELEETIQSAAPEAERLAELLKAYDEYLFLGGGPGYASALFSSAKLLEATGDSTGAQDTEEWAHLNYFAKAVETPTFIITAGERDYSRAVEVAVAARTIGRQVVAIAPAASHELAGQAVGHLRTAAVPEMYAPILSSACGALFAAARAETIGEPYFRAFGGGRSPEGGGGISRIRTSETWEDLQP